MRVDLGWQEGAALQCRTVGLERQTREDLEDQAGNGPRSRREWGIPNDPLPRFEQKKSQCPTGTATSNTLKVTPTPRELSITLRCAGIISIRKTL